MMIIRSPANTYTVFARFRGSVRRVLAQDANGQPRLLLLVERPAQAPCTSEHSSGYRADSQMPQCPADSFPTGQPPFDIYMPVLYQENPAFTDFIESFTYNEWICAVFRHPDTQRMHPLRKILVDSPPELRATVLRALFAKLLAQDPPASMICDLLRAENLLCSPAGEIGFIYDIRLEQNGSQNVSLKAVAEAMLCLSETTREICGDISLPALTALYEALSPAEPCGWPELFAAASAAGEELALYRPEPPPPVLSLRERISLAKEKLSGHIAELVAFALLAAGYILLGVLFYYTVIAPNPVDNGLNAIGTVIVEDAGTLPAV